MNKGLQSRGPHLLKMRSSEDMMSNSDIIMAIVTFNQRQRSARFFWFSFFLLSFFLVCLQKNEKNRKKGRKWPWLHPTIHHSRLLYHRSCNSISANSTSLGKLDDLPGKRIIFLMVFFHFGGHFAKKIQTIFCFIANTRKLDVHLVNLLKSNNHKI